jgi:ABC-type dipeptide/oligopeptide/nickel transport system ATPase component
MNQIQMKMDRKSEEIKKSLNILNNQVSAMVSSSHNWNKKISAVVQEFENSLELLKKIKSQLTK